MFWLLADFVRPNASLLRLIDPDTGVDIRYNSLEYPTYITWLGYVATTLTPPIANDELNHALLDEVSDDGQGLPRH